MSEEVVKRDSEGMAAWSGAAARGLQARREREAIIEQVLVPGVDYGKIPGTDKETLLKPGAEKITDCLGLYPDYEPLQVIEDFDKGLFFYRYRCVLRVRGSNAAVATGIGSCNSREARYRFRKAERKCPDCGKAAIIKGKAEYGGGWVCFKKKDGCGAKFPDDYKLIVDQPAGMVENTDIASLVNTIDKMAQKRGLVAANLNLGFSHKFTQDMEDSAVDNDALAWEDEPGSNDGPPPETAKPVVLISDAQRRRIFGIAKENSVSEAVVKAIVEKHGFSSSSAITRDKYEAIVEEVKTWKR